MFGIHLLGDLDGCEVDEKLLKRRPFDRYFEGSLDEFVLDVCKAADMQPMGKVHVDEYGGPHESWKGLSATLHIQTSHISVHTFAFGYVFLDLFSCKPFDTDAVQKFVATRLQPQHQQWRTVARGYNFPYDKVDERMQKLDPDTFPLRPKLEIHSVKGA